MHALVAYLIILISRRFQRDGAAAFAEQHIVRCWVGNTEAVIANGKRARAAIARQATHSGRS